MKTFKLDSMIVEYKMIEKNVFHIYLQYNNLMSQTDFIIDLEHIHPGIIRIFTTRQLNILLNKLRKEIAVNG